MNHTERYLIDRARRDRSAYGALYTMYRGKVFGFFLKRLGGNREVAQDLTQETFVRAYKSHDRYLFKGYSYGAYLFTIARRLLINYYKKKESTPLDEVSSHPDLTIPSPEEEYRYREVWSAVKNLAERDRRVLFLKYKKGKTVREIAQELSTSENAIKLVLSRARKKLKKSLGTSSPE